MYACTLTCGHEGMEASRRGSMENCRHSGLCARLGMEVWRTLGHLGAWRYGQCRNAGMRVYTHVWARRHKCRGVKAWRVVGIQACMRT
jgi:hypothetical protein